MLSKEIQIYLDAFRRLIRRGGTTNIKKMLDKIHPADLAMVFRHLAPGERQMLFGMLPTQLAAAELLSELDQSLIEELLSTLEPLQIANIFQEIQPDDQADILGYLSEEKSQVVLELLQSKQTSNVEALLQYAPDTAGGLMTPDVFLLSQDTTAKDAIEKLQESESAEMVFYIYVVEENNHLVGVISLRQLLTVAPTTLLKDIMIHNVLTVTPETDQEDVAKIVSRYNILAVPVVDEFNKLLGIVTVDDVIDVIREEATEDILQMAGAGSDHEIASKSAWENAKIRMPWLFASLLGGLAAFYVITQFENTLSKIAILAAFIPVIMGMGGNIGTQSSTIVVRGIATGRIAIAEAWKVLFKESRVGLLLGISYGILLAICVIILQNVGVISSGQNPIVLGAVIGSSLAISMIASATIGTFIPIFLERMDIDPAVATGPFVTTFIDIMGIGIYFTIATTFLSV